MSKLKLPPVTQEALLFVDGTPDMNYPIRILKAHLVNARCKWASAGGSDLSPVLQAMNETQDKRAELLKQAIADLEKAQKAQKERERP